MGAAFELKNANLPGLVNDLHTAWRDIYSVIGMRQGMSTEALRFAATLRVEESPNRPLGEEAAVDCLRGLARNAKTIREVADWMLKVTQACDLVMANPRLNAVTGISQARLLAVAIHLRHDIVEKDRNDLLKQWEKVSFRIYGMLGYDKRWRVGDYVRLAWQTENEGLTAKQIGAGIAEIGEDFSVEEAVKALRNTDRYEGWQDELRYFMFRYEEHLAKKQGMNFRNEQWEKIWMVSPAESIEHIWAKSKAKEKHKHRLGNLVLLPPKLNAKLQDDDPVDKVAEYRKTGLLIAGEVADIIENGSWNVKAIASREDDLVDWAKTEWAD
jgi:hypothetical protein